MKRSGKSFFASSALALSMLGSMLFSSPFAAARPLDSGPAKGVDQPKSGAIVVTPSNLQGWRFMEEDTAAGGGMLVNGPATPPIGTGSAKLWVDGAGRFLMSNLAYAGTRLADITSLAYSTYTEGSSNILAPSLQLDVDYDLTDNITGWQGRLVYEPYMDGSVVTPGSWQTWSPMTGKWWASGGPGSGTCPQGTPCTWSQVLTAFPNAGLRAGNGWLHFRVGGPWTGGFTGYVDGFTMGVSGNSTTYNFELPAGTKVAGTCPGATHATINAAIAAAAPGETIQICPGTFNENVNVNKNGITLVGAGASSNPAYGTVIDGASIGANPGIALPNGVTGVSIRNLRVQNFASNSGIYGALGNNNFTVDSVTVYNNNSAAAGNNGGIYMNGPVSNVTINNVTSDSNKQRGIVIWNGFKQNITITNNIVTNNVCCGIELQDGTASGVTITGNTVAGNADSGIAAIGLMAGAGPNLIANNTLANNGRFGIEIKLPNGTGLESGDGSIVVASNFVTRTVSIGAEQRDIAGISVYRRGWLAGENNVDIPTGVVVKNNTVGGYTQPSVAEGFGIVVESLQTNVYGNTLVGNDVGIQRQAGHGPYTPNSNVNGEQGVNPIAPPPAPPDPNADPDNYFGRGNSPAVCALIGANTYSGNGANTRDVGPVNAAPCYSAYSHINPISPLTVTSGSTFTLDLMVNSGGDNVRAAQNYLTFPTDLLQNIDVSSGNPSNSLTPDLTSLNVLLQNQVCNTPTQCTFGALQVPGGSISYASGIMTGTAPTGDFRVAQMRFAANQIGTATVHWQFSPPDPANRNSKITDADNNVISTPANYTDYVINIVHAVFQGHVTWQGRPAQPNALQARPLTLTLINGANTYTYAGLTTDANGNFTVNLDNLPDGTYTWRVKGPTYLSTTGTFAFSHATLTTVEMGLQPAGDANNDNLVDITDFGILYGAFGCVSPAPCFDARVDWSGDNLVDITDFALLAGNFGRVGNRPVEGPSQTRGNAMLELRPAGKAPANGGTVRVGDTFTLELWVNAKAGTNVLGQQGYIAFPAGMLRLGNPQISPSSGSTTTITPDNGTFNVMLQNAVCNGPAGCAYKGAKLPAGVMAFASGLLNSAGVSGSFRVGEIKVVATAPGTARLHWETVLTSPNGRSSKVVAADGTTVSQPLQFVDYILNVVPAGK